ncbi:MAG: hypothetical protein FH761_08515 [Firmicutes bacterium]|nr:hypothetical protein [Bacillota bacterium]
MKKNMAAYFAMRVMDKEESDGIETAQAYYIAVFSIPAYQPYQAETDMILMSEGKDYLIPEME